MKIDVNVLLKAIHKKCLDCCAGAWSELEKCDITYCPLYSYRKLKEETITQEVCNNAQRTNSIRKRL